MASKMLWQWLWLCVHTPSRFPEKKFAQAIVTYTQAIDSNPYVAVYYANRAAAHIKLENYGSALQDATTSIKLDRTYIKVLLIMGADRLLGMRSAGAGGLASRLLHCCPREYSGFSEFVISESATSSKPC